MSEFDYIREQVPQSELLAQLAEEAIELAHAALKLRRVYDGTNPTPVKRSEAFANLKEELADVELLLMVLGYDRGMLISEKHRIMDAKLQRWVSRLKEKERTEAE